MSTLTKGLNIISGMGLTRDALIAKVLSGEVQEGTTWFSEEDYRWHVFVGGADRIMVSANDEENLRV